jgi:hypothetical protein
MYHELNLLSEVSLGEEARHNMQSGPAVCEAMNREPNQYASMDDYSYCLREHPVPGAFLTGDTCVRSMLDKKKKSPH